MILKRPVTAARYGERPVTAARYGGPPTVPFPVQISSSGADTQHLSLSEALALAAEIEAVVAEIEEAREGHVVKVLVGGREYSYRDPSGTLTVGARVLVPFGFRDELRPAEVTGFGRGSWTGPLKDVNSRIQVEELSA